MRTEKSLTENIVMFQTHMHISYILRGELKGDEMMTEISVIQSLPHMNYVHFGTKKKGEQDI